MRHLTHSGRENFSACVAMLVVTTVLMIARFAVRASHRQAPMVSDWICLLSLAFFYAYCGVLLNCQAPLPFSAADGHLDLTGGGQLSSIRLRTDRLTLPPRWV